MLGCVLIVPGKHFEKTEEDNQSVIAPESKPQSRFTKRYFGFRIAAVLLGLLPFLVLELVLSFGGWKQTDSVKDPYVGFASVRPLFLENHETKKYQIADYRKPLFCADSFPIEKASNEFRIFCIGGSTVQGRPFAIETSFTAWLEESLKAADESVSWKVVNCGGVSYASYRLAPIFEEVLSYEPDLVVLYTGHNEFLEDRTYESIKSSPFVVGVHERLSCSKTYSFLRSLVVDSSPPRDDLTVLPEEVEARLDFRGGLDKYTRDDAWRSSVVSHFEHNLRRMLSAAKAADVPVILCNPVANLRDASPFKSENDGLTAIEAAQFEREWAAIEAKEVSEVELGKLESLVELYPRHAGLRYRIGQQYQLAGDFEKAKLHLIEAKEQDVCPLRIVEPMYQAIENVRDEFEPIFVDVRSNFEERAEDRIPGRELLVDHVHPSIRGHQLIAELLFNEMVAQRMVQPSENFEVAKSERFESHLSHLPHMYFQLGKDRLAGLRRWAEGKVKREK